MAYIFHISNQNTCYLETENHFQTKLMHNSKLSSVFLKVDESMKVLTQFEQTESPQPPALET